MFDISFVEIALVMVIALLVLGPERLPRAAKMVGLWVRRAKASWYSVKAEFERELADEELKRSLQEAQRDINEAKKEFEAATREPVAAVDEVSKATGEASRSLKQSLAADAAGTASGEKAKATADDAPAHMPASASQDVQPPGDGADPGGDETSRLQSDDHPEDDGTSGR